MRQMYSINNMVVRQGYAPLSVSELDSLGFMSTNSFVLVKSTIMGEGGGGVNKKDWDAQRLA